ncbi:ABC transporter ATP-binding protein [Brevibacterium sp.]|uniref:ABC transporter ATP-binding protein n=1 Tax=Brevibacterium sp. TaxID=1701 RepID=UPI0026343321|nr:ABC transporter ATP-binding protein [Brevibacterium sp.]
MNSSPMHTDTLPSTIATTTPAIRAVGLRKTYGDGEAIVRPLNDLSLDIEAGRFTAIMGPSGSGKSTLLNMLAGLDTPDSGEVIIGGTALSGLSDRKLTAIRRDRIGFVFQSFNLVPAMDAVENILLPMQLSGKKPDRRVFRRMVDLLGLSDRLHHRPHELSGGQQQRVAVARALVSQPDVIVADEPTGNLDSNAGEEVLSILRSSVDELGQTVVMVTHDPRAAARADRVVLLADGRLAGELTDPDPESVATALMNLTATTGGSNTAASRSGASHAATAHEGGAR